MNKVNQWAGSESIVEIHPVPLLSDCGFELVNKSMSTIWVVLPPRYTLAFKLARSVLQ